MCNSYLDLGIMSCLLDSYLDIEIITFLLNHYDIEIISCLLNSYHGTEDRFQLPLKQ